MNDAPHFVLNMDADDRPAIDDMSDGNTVVEEHDDGESVSGKMASSPLAHSDDADQVGGGR